MFKRIETSVTSLATRSGAVRPVNDTNSRTVTEGLVRRSGVATDHVPETSQFLLLIEPLFPQSLVIGNSVQSWYFFSIPGLLRFPEYRV